jgi:serine/threonine-protein kinase
VNPGTVVTDRFRIESELGRGGMGVVYAAVDLRHSRHVALKVLERVENSAAATARFFAEIQTAAGLSHPNILPVHDSGEIDGKPYYVMPLVEGETLRGRMARERRLPVEETLRITRQLCAALTHAHALGVVHRDIKPENVLLDRSGHVYLADFGIARSLQKDLHLTADGASLGSPLYMSPEQISGIKDLDGGSDVYSLGCVVFEMLAGEPPFAGPVATAVLASHLVDEPPSLRQRRADVPLEVDGAVRQAMAKERASRFPTAAAFSEALGTTGTTLLSAPPSLARAGIRHSIRERRLFPILGVYAASGWVAVEVLNVFIERGQLAPVLFPVALLWFVGGLFATVIVLWYHGEKGGQAVKRNEVALLTTVGVVVLSGTGTVVSRSLSAVPPNPSGGGGALDPHRIAVLYFEDATPTHTLEHVADALTEALIDELDRVPSLNVLSENGALQYRGSSLALDSVAREVRAGTIVTGIVQEIDAPSPATSGGTRAEDERIRIEVSIVDGETGTTFRRGSLERPTSEILALPAGVAGEVSDLLREWLGQEVLVRAQQQETESVAAWSLLQRAERFRKQGERLFYDDGAAVEAVDAFLVGDSVAALAEQADPGWTRPTVLRSLFSRRMAQLHYSDGFEAETFLQQGIEQAERVLAADRRDAAALEARGVLRYLRWRLNLEHDPVEAQSLLRSASEDLQAAVEADPSRAESWNALSIVHAENSDQVGALYAARRAYEEDAYLRSAADLLNGLYATSYDLEQFANSGQYCQEGQRRFPDDPRFVECELWLLSSPGLPANVDRAWEIYEQYQELVPPNRTAYAHSLAGLLVGGVLVRASMKDSADAVLRRHRAETSVDLEGELFTVEAVFRVRLGQEGEAIRLIQRYLTVRPDHREGWEKSSHWWWRPLQDNEAFRALVASGR